MERNIQLKPLLDIEDPLLIHDERQLRPQRSTANVSPRKHCQRKYLHSYITPWLGVILIIILVYFVHEYNNNRKINKFMTENSYTLGDLKYYHNITEDHSALYVVYNDKCHIPNFNVFNKEANRLMKKLDFINCTKYDPLTYIKTVGNQSVLYIDYNKRNYYALYGKLTCCYSIVGRKNPSLDDAYLISKCKFFEKSAFLNRNIDFLIVKCYQVTNSAVNLVYSKIHTKVSMKKHIRRRLDSFKQIDNTQPISVIMIAFDSIARLNLYRQMPKTVNYIQSKGWLQLRGYNKIASSTWLNIMAILTGYNSSQIEQRCDTKTEKFDECPLLLYKYRDKGYATTYAEDEEVGGCFNYRAPGFYHPPTDYYIRPLMRAGAHFLRIIELHTSNFCVGPDTSEEIILNYATQFMETYKNDPYFGLFWLNSFSHDDFNDPSRVDSQTKQWFYDNENSGLFNSSIVIFLSDHGMPHGEIRHTYTGWLEVRLPFLFIRFPEWFRNKFPTAVNNFKLNENRLTSPYDLFITLQDILIKSGRLKVITPSLSCPTCQSLLDEVPYHRGCEDASIGLDYCTCHGLQRLDHHTPAIKNIGKFLVKQLQNILEKNSETLTLCRKPGLKRIITVRESKSSKPNVKYYFLTIEVNPRGQFEGMIEKTIDRNGQNSFELKGSIKRVDMYLTQSHCIRDGNYKPYCYCKKQLKV